MVLLPQKSLVLSWRKIMLFLPKEEIWIPGAEALFVPEERFRVNFDDNILYIASLNPWFRERVRVADHTQPHSCTIRCVVTVKDLSHTEVVNTVRGTIRSLYYVHYLIALQGHGEKGFLLVDGRPNFFMMRLLDDKTYPLALFYDIWSTPTGWCIWDYTPLALESSWMWTKGSRFYFESL